MDVIKIPFGPFKDFDAYMAHRTKPKAEGETLTSVSIYKTPAVRNRIGILIPVTRSKEAEKIKKRIYHRFTGIENLVYEDPEPKPQF